ncbi:MAG TPA: transglutaminase-like domain-containing protein [Kofleriaceae bacterium]|nr:transglutaminase-like domain-containing protein [Kofleriaceae bacterium]
MRPLCLAAIVGTCAAAAACQSKRPSPAERTPDEPAAAPAPTPTPPDGPRQLGIPLEGHLVSQATVDRIFARGTREQWFGLYVQGKKLGYSSIQLRLPAPGEPGGLVWSVSARLRAETDVDLVEQRYYEGSAPYRLVEIRSGESSAQGRVERRYRRDGDQFILRQTVDGTPQPERRVAGTAETALSLLDHQAVEPGEVKAGMSITVREFDTESETDKASAIKIVEIRKERLSGVDTEVVVMSAQTEGEQTVSTGYVASGGVVLRATLGGGIELRWEEKEQAQSDVAGFDMIADAVKIDRPIGEPSNIRELKLRVALPGDLALRDAPNQELTRRGDGSFDVDLFSRPGLPVLPAERRAALAVTATIDAGDPAVVEQARAITADESDPARRVERLVQWVYTNLEKDLSTTLITASQVLARKQGDCTEHAILFVALARAAGIPAREVSGLVYMGDGIQRFGWHAWAEVDLGGRWVQVDPSWNETLANATHLTLGVGDESDWVAALGGLTIQLRDAR